MQAKNDFQSIKFRAFVRTDDLEGVSLDKAQEYKCSPASHMNIGQNGDRDYLQSGYLSTFEFDNNSGLAATVAYAAGYKNIHFIFIPENLCHTIYLRGGTAGLEKDGEITKPILSPGNCWDQFARNQFIPEIFKTESMSIALPQGTYISKSETLLGGNWQDYAICFTLTKGNARKIMEQKYKNETELFNILKAHIPINQFNYAEKINFGFTAKILQQWWSELQPDEKKLLCLLRALEDDLTYMTPSPQHDFAMLKQLSVIFARNDYYKKTSPNLKSYLELLNKCYELSVNSGLYNQELLLLSHEWRKTIASEIEGDQTTREELNNLESHYEHLQAEINFLKNIEQTYQYFPERLPQERQNALEYINRVRQTNCTSAQKIEQINATSKQLEIIKIQNNIFTCGWRLLTKPASDFKQRELNHCKSNLYILGEWFNAWTQKVRDELSLISMPDLICINNSCDEIKSNLERLSRLYALKKEDTSSFVPEFDKQLLLTLKDIQENFSQQGPVEISRFLHQKTTHFCCLLIQKRNGFFAVPDALQKLNELHLAGVKPPSPMEL